MDMRDDELVSVEFREPGESYVIPAENIVPLIPSLCDANADLMARLIAAQNAIKAPIDIMTFAHLCETRAELRAHVERYEVQVAAEIFEAGLKPIVRKIRERNRSRARRAAKKLAA
jgi:hypothetical protein